MPTKQMEDTDDLVNGTTGIGGDEYYPMGEGDDAGGADDPVADTGTDDTPPPVDDLPPVDDEPPPPEMKPGARALTEVYEHLMDLSEVISRLNESQENPEVVKAIDKFASVLDKQMGEAVGLFGKLYPDQPPLGPGEADVDAELPEEPADDDATDPVDEEEDEGFDYETKSAEGMNEAEGESGGYLTKRHQSRKVKHFKKRLHLAREWRSLVRSKRLSKSHTGLITKAAEHLETSGDHEGDWTATHKAACHYHAKALRGMCKSFTSAQAGTEGDLERGGIPSEVKKSLQRLGEYEKKVPSLLRVVEQLKRELRLARTGR